MSTRSETAGRAATVVGLLLTAVAAVLIVAMLVGGSNTGAMLGTAESGRSAR
ncbi:hypothetical protein [Salinibacterium sp. ZJ454]|uniref:hypothetical protein n=1 Tax=Salinibacterium sp. ZJ454 TaxID=2708339 RepID=UPI001422CD28|nr:hypothetical protein [Salinibacterium sp. ZJ454]